MHEARMWPDNCFVTLTYSEENLPVDMSVDLSVFQKFMKRLRFEKGPGVRFIGCGEYGDEFGRPHYHICLFNCGFEDKRRWKMVNGNWLFTSELLSRLWPLGFSSVGALTFESAAYVARYSMKKIQGVGCCPVWIDPKTLITYRRSSEFFKTSRGGRGGLGGIGRPYLEKYGDEILKHDSVVVRGHECSVPRYYDDYFCDRREHLRNKRKRKSAAATEKVRGNNTSSRHRVRERVTEARVELLKRGMEEMP